MTIRRYDETVLIKRLELLPRALRVAFAASCAQRLLPAYAAFSAVSGQGSPNEVEQAIGRVWSGLFDPSMPEVERDIARIMELIPREDGDEWFSEQPYAEDATAALAYALRTAKSGEAQEAAWAARRAYEALDHHVMNRLGIEGEEEVLSHPLIQAEFVRQDRDLAMLESAAGTDASARAAVNELRTRSLHEALLMFDAEGGVS